MGFEAEMMPPTWAIGLFIACFLIVFFLLPQHAVNFVLHSDQSKMVAVGSGAITFFVIIATAYQIWFDLRDRAEERVVRRDEAISRAWDRLLSRASGNTGKGGALSLLLRENEDISGLDLSCRTRGDWDEEAESCRRQVIYSGLELNGFPKRKVIAEIDLSDARLSLPDLRGVEFLGATMDRAEIADFNAQDSSFVASFDDTKFVNGSLAHTLLHSTGPERPQLQQVNISGAVIPWLDELSETDLNELYYWADLPPQRTINGFSVQFYAQFWETQSDDDVFPFFGTLVANKMNICRPPIDKGGHVIPEDKRTISILGHMYTTVLRFRCDPISAEAAMALFPQAYAKRMPHGLLAAAFYSAAPGRPRGGSSSP